MLNARYRDSRDTPDSLATLVIPRARHRTKRVGNDLRIARRERFGNKLRLRLGGLVVLRRIELPVFIIDFLLGFSGPANVPGR